MDLKTAANNLARLIEQGCLDAIEVHYHEKGNVAMPSIIRQAIRDVDEACAASSKTSAIEVVRQAMFELREAIFMAAPAPYIKEWDSIIERAAERLKAIKPTAAVVELERRRLKLWLHLVSEHKAQLDPFEPLASLEDMHQHEHTGPGTLGKGEPIEPLPFNMRSVGEVFSEGDEDGSPWDQDR